MGKEKKKSNEPDKYAYVKSVLLIEEVKFKLNFAEIFPKWLFETLLITVLIALCSIRQFNFALFLLDILNMVVRLSAYFV